MAFRDLRAFCAHLEGRGRLHRVPTPVSAELELAEVAARAAGCGGPALLFERVEGHAAPVLVGAFAGPERAAWALGAEELEGLTGRLEEVLGVARGGVAGGIGSRLRSLGELAGMRAIAPRRVERGACQEVVEPRPALETLPAPRHWPGDGGRTIALPLLVSRDRAAGRRVVATGRLQIHDDATTSWPVRPAPRERTPAAVVIGGDPTTIFAATAPLPTELDPLLFAGFLRRAPVDVVRCRTIDLEVPAAAEYVLEGHVEPEQPRPAGPFGERTGYYAPAAEAPTFRVSCVTRRRAPIYLDSLPGRQGDELWLGKAAERLTLPFVRLMQPEVVDLNAPAEGSFRSVLLVSIRKQYPGQAQKVIAGLFGLMPTLLARAIVVVDHDVDVRDLAACAWRTSANVDWRRDVMVLDGPLDPLDHAAPGVGVGAKIGIDATRKLDDERHPREWPAEVEMSAEVRALVDRKWGSYGIPL
ncbi:MAG TPA: UbiD family decarboxylase [Chloroflexota bacterium]